MKEEWDEDEEDNRDSAEDDSAEDEDKEDDDEEDGDSEDGDSSDGEDEVEDEEGNDELSTAPAPRRQKLADTINYVKGKHDNKRGATVVNSTGDYEVSAPPPKTLLTGPIVIQ